MALIKNDTNKKYTVIAKSLQHSLIIAQNNNKQADLKALGQREFKSACNSNMCQFKFACISIGRS